MSQSCFNFSLHSIFLKQWRIYSPLLLQFSTKTRDERIKVARRMKFIVRLTDSYRTQWIYEANTCTFLTEISLYHCILQNIAFVTSSYLLFQTVTTILSYLHIFYYNYLLLITMILNQILYVNFQY